MEPIVDFLDAQVDSGEPVDVVFFQEVVGGALSGVSNSAKFIQEQLSIRGVEYNLKTAFEVGIPGVFYTGNSILSRCEIQFSLVKRLPRESEIELFGRVINLPRNVQMARLKIPGFRKLNVYNTHLCAGCTLEEREEQLLVMLGFMNNLENLIPGKNPILLAGDFNIDIFKDNDGGTYGPEKDLYDIITMYSGFDDAYAEGASDSLEYLCPDENSPDEDCTVGVTALDLSDGGKAGRIDYIFKMGPGLRAATNSTVFFNPVVTGSPYDLVSDHAAVFVRIPLQF